MIQLDFKPLGGNKLDHNSINVDMVWNTLLNICKDVHGGIKYCTKEWHMFGWCPVLQFNDGTILYLVGDQLWTQDELYQDLYDTWRPVKQEEMDWSIAHLKHERYAAGKYRVPKRVPANEDAQKMRDLAVLVKDNLNDANLGFALIVFPFGDGGTTSYVSNARREDMVNALEELLAKWKNKSDIQTPNAN